MNIIVSDHAVLRWLERGHGVDIEFFRRSIRDKVKAGIRLGASGVVIDGVRFVLDEHRVVTVTPTRGKRNR